MGTKKEKKKKKRYLPIKKCQKNENLLLSVPVGAFIACSHRGI